MAKTNKRRLTKSERNGRIEKTVSFICLAVFALIWVFPLVYMVGTSFKSELDLQLHPDSLFPSAPSEWTLKHYAGFFVGEDGALSGLPIWMLNSLWSSFASVGLTVLLDLITAYAVVFLKFRGKDVLMKFLYLWLAVPGVIGTAASFAIFAAIRNSLHITGMPAYFYIYMWLIVPGTTGIFNMLLMRNFFASIPKDIVESAQSDGASNAKIFFKVVCPLAKSTVMLIVLFTFNGSWNNLLGPQMMLTGESSYWKTITVGLIGYTGGSAWSYVGVAMATSVFSLIPIVILFIITQNKMIDGLATTGIKR